MSEKRARIATIIEKCQGQALDARYLGYFECFNRGQFYEAHEVLESLWLPDRKGPNGAFYKGLIQFAGAFVLLQKERLAPAARLFKLALANLRTYPDRHEQLDVAHLRSLIETWLLKLEDGRATTNSLTTTGAPRLRLIPAT